MTLPHYSLAIIACIALQCMASGEVLREDDVATCMELCSGCDGTATFEEGRCQCHVPDDHQNGADCMNRMKRQAEELGLNLVSCNLAEVDRPARCLLGPMLGARRRFGSRSSDADLVAKYFMNGGALGGLPPLLGNANVDRDEKTTDGTNTATGAEPNNRMNGPINPMTGGPNLFTNGLPGANPVYSNGPYAGQGIGSMVGAPNPYQNNPLMDMLGKYLNPNVLLGIANGLMGGNNPGMQNQLGARNPMDPNDGLVGQQYDNGNNEMNGSDNPMTGANPAIPYPNGQYADPSMGLQQNLQQNNPLMGLIGQYQDPNGFLGAGRPLNNYQNFLGAQQGFINPGMQSYADAGNQMGWNGGLVGQQNAMDDLSDSGVDDTDDTGTNAVGGVQQPMGGNFMPMQGSSGPMPPQSSGDTEVIGGPMQPYYQNPFAGSFYPQMGAGNNQGVPNGLVGAGYPYGMPNYFNQASNPVGAPDSMMSSPMGAAYRSSNQADGPNGSNASANVDNAADDSEEGGKPDTKVGDKLEKPAKRPKKPTKESKLGAAAPKKYRSQKLGASKSNPGQYQKNTSKMGSDNVQSSDPETSYKDPNNTTSIN